MHTYSKKTLNRFKNPKFAGEIKNADAVGEEGNIKCGDVMRIFLKVDKNKGIIKDVKFQTYGCVAAIAASDAMCEIVKGKTLEQAEKLTWNDIVKELGNVPPIKYHCSILGTDALKNAIENYKKGQGDIVKDTKNSTQQTKTKSITHIKNKKQTNSLKKK